VDIKSLFYASFKKNGIKYPTVPTLVFYITMSYSNADGDWVTNIPNFRRNLPPPPPSLDSKLVGLEVARYCRVICVEPWGGFYWPRRSSILSLVLLIVHVTFPM
jgi:hypothetical protein